MAHESWGKWIRSTPARVLYEPRFDDLILPYGLGRSYGDVCLNNGHTLLDTSRMSHLLAFDDETGVLTCEAGATLDDILQVLVPRGWFLPVTPGTKFVTVGGCIANDVHGKNHHRAGTFGRHVLSFELLRSDGARIHCTPTDDLFRATVGGLGLTGLILTAQVQLRRIESPAIVEERIPFRSLAEFESLSAASDATHEYTVAWLDTFRTRGLFIRGNHASSPRQIRRPARRSRKLPMAPVAPFLTRATVRALNTAYFHGTSRAHPKPVHYDPFFYPLDAIANWNSVYGRRGFLQYQFVIPEEQGMQPVAEILGRLKRAGSSLTVIKKFGALQSPGMLSFPRLGTTVSMDFAAGDELLPLLDQCDALVEAAGGSVYPAKDARMAPERFRRFFPQWEDFRRHTDPQFSSSFWRRVMQ
ncbi:MAG TPA: FAD-binding oxidoreductase [Thermoanaerobaculia bacterium]|nr:FAD-binding oxidoreductase [Thermoanaerobaculia bacterium]